MSVVIQKKDLLDAMQKALPVVPSKVSLQILSNFKLSYANSVLEILATDADHSLRVTVGASGDEPLDITVNARKVFEMVREIHDGDVTITADGLVLALESEKGYKGKISGADSSDFPGVPSIEDGIEFSADGPTLCEMIYKSAFAVSKDESRQSLCGVLWEVSADRMGMVATDGQRLGYTFVNTTLPIGGEPLRRILSQKSVATLQRVVDSKNKDESVRVKLGDKYVSFETPAFSMVSKLIEGQYPEYNMVIPKNNPKVVVADRVSILESIRRVSVLSNQKSHYVKFIFTPGQLEFSVRNREIGGEARDAVVIDYDGDEHHIGFNGANFSDILEIMKTEKVRLEMNTQLSACLIHPQYADEKDKTSEDLYLIMPMRIMDEG